MNDKTQDLIEETGKYNNPERKHKLTMDSPCNLEDTPDCDIVLKEVSQSVEKIVMSSFYGSGVGQKKNASIISAFPGIGKSFFAKNYKHAKVLDLDSSNFSKNANGSPNAQFPTNYIDAIFDNIDKYDYILISTHEAVIQAVSGIRWEYYVIYPERGAREEYIRRFKERGDNEAFINLIDTNWDKFISEVNSNPQSIRIPVCKTQYLMDLFDDRGNIR